MDIATNSKDLIESFIDEHVTRQGLDDRTEKAYRLDLKLFSVWLGQKETQISAGRGNMEGDTVPKTLMDDGGRIINKKADDQEGLEAIRWEECTEDYLSYLAAEKKLSFSTISRKNKVITYYLSYLAEKGMITGYQPSVKVIRRKRAGKNRMESPLLSKKDADAFFAALNREYEDLDSEFRRRICLRDMVMMELLFYHKIEISELLRMQVQDYDTETGTLEIRKKREERDSMYLYSRELRRKMRLWLKERECLKHDREYENTMFLSKLGKPLSMEMVVKIFDKYRELAGIEKKFTPRDLKEGVMKQYARELIMERWG